MDNLTMESLANADRDRLLTVVEELMHSRDDLEARRFIESKLAHFSNISRYGDEDTLKIWGARVLEELADVFHIIHGSLYISDADRNNDEPPLKLAAAYSFNAEYLQKEVAYGEGIVGQAVKTRKPVKILGSDIKVRFETSMADVSPRALMIYPLLFNFKVQGLLEFSTQHELSDKLQQLMDLLAENLAANMLTIRSQEQMRALFSESQQRSEELQAQEEEMRQNVEELEATQEEMRRAQAGLENFRVFITNIIDSTPTMFIGTDGEGTIKYWNKAAGEALGYTAEEMIDKQTPAIFHDLDEIKAEHARLSEEYEADIPMGFDVFKFLPYQGKVYEREWTYIHKDGARFPVMLTISAWQDKDGTYGGLLGVARDLRKDKALEAEAKARQEEFNRMVDNVPGMVYQYTFVPETGWHGFTFVSEKSREMFGFEPEEIMVSQEESPLEVHPDDAPRFEQAFAKALEKMSAFRLELRLKPKTADYKLVRAVSRPRQAGPNVVFDGLLLDISEEKSREEALAKSSAQISELEKDRELLEAANNEGVWFWDLTTNEVTYNDRFFTMLGYTKEEIGGGLQAFQKLVHPDDEEHAFQNVEQFVKGELGKYEIIFRMRHKDGSSRVILSRGALETDEEGKPFRLVGTHADITEFARMD